MSAKEYSVNHYNGMLYRCVECGREEEFDGLAVKARSPMGDDADCFMCDMELVDREAYWNGEIEPDETISFV